MKKTIKRITLIAISIILCFVLLTGCIRSPDNPPVGYAYGGREGAPIRSSRGNARYSIYFQFHETNVNRGADSRSRQYFFYDSQLHFVTIHGSYGPRIGTLIAVYRIGNQSERIGSFVTEVDSRANYHEVLISFVHTGDIMGSFIYYQLAAVRSYIASIGIGATERTLFFKYTHFRLCLNTGRNEEVELLHFFHRLQPIYRDTTLFGNVFWGNHFVELNPNFRVRQ